MPPLVSVVIPCFNAGRMLEPALWSVFAQSYPNLEVIFVDNNSTDGSAELARSFAAGKSRPFRFAHCPEQGANRARNMGYALASGDYIQWMEADDALGLEKIALQVHALEQDRDAGIAYCDWMGSRHLPDGRRMDTVTALSQVDDQILRTLSGVWFPPHSYLVRREAADLLQAERAWLPETTMPGDIEYIAIAALLGIRFRHVPGAKVQYNIWSQTQATRSETPYAARVAAFRTIWIRLQEIARRPDVAGRITDLHHMLLHLDWSVWSMPLGSVEISTLAAEQHALRHVASSRTFETGPREATIATAMLTAGHGRALLHHALMIAKAVPSLRHDHAGIVATLDWFRREGLLRAVDLADEPLPTQADDTFWPATGMVGRDAEVGQGASPPLPAGSAAPSPQRAAAPATRKVVSQAWTEVLGAAGLAENQRFDAAGGDSMALLNLALSCEARLGVPVPLDALSVRMRASDIVRVVDRILGESAGSATEAATGTEAAAGKANLPTIFLIRVRHQMDMSEPVLRQACAGRAKVVALAQPAWPAFVEPDFDLAALLDGIVSAIELRAGAEPVKLFGMCFGGFLAYLAAQRLAAAGRRIGFVGVVDADAAWPEAGAPAQLGEMLRALLEGPQFSGLAPPVAKFLTRHPRLLRRLNRDGLLARLPRKFAAKLNWQLNFELPARFDKGGLARLMKASGRLDAPVFLFRTLEQMERAPADLHWRDRCTDVTVVPLLGNHFNLFAPQNLPVAHQALSLATRQAIAGSSARQTAADARLELVDDDEAHAGTGIEAAERQIA